MDILQAIIIGIVQGLTEFLPVSSSAHLIFVQNLLGIPDVGLDYDVILHAGTLIAVMWFFRVDIVKLLASLVDSLFDLKNRQFKQGLAENPFKRLGWYVILATIPLVIVGYFFESQVDALYIGALFVPAFFLFVTGTILYISQRMNSGEINMNNIGPKESLLMGLGQACAVFPGLSRSGTTIAAGLVAGLDKEFAAKFSFILSIPTMIGAVVLKFIIKSSELNLSSIDFIPALTGFIITIIVGYFAIKWLLEIIQKRSLDCFAYYCWIVGIVVFVGSIAHIF